MQFAMLTPVMATSDADNGNFWHKVCNMDSTTSMCTSYVRGVIEGAVFQSGYSKTALPFCAPDGVQYGQFKDIFVKYLRDHPEKRHLSTSVLVMIATTQAYPCN